MDDDLKYKICITCKQSKTLVAENFYRRSKGSTDGFHNKCKQCMNDYFKKHSKTPSGLASEKRKQEKKKKQRREFVKKLQMENRRQCTKCKEIFPLTEDHYKITVRQNKSVYSKKCIKCYINPYHVVENGVEKKQCSVCKEYKLATTNYFHSAKSQTSGLYSICKVCKDKKSKAWKKQRILRGVSGVYEIINHANNKSYIGESKAINMRWQTHWRKLRSNRHDNKKIQADYNLYGEENFEYKILLELPDDKNVRLLEEAKEIQNRLKAGQELYNLQLTIKQVKMLTEEK